MLQCVYKVIQISKVWEGKSWRSLSLIVAEGKNGKAERREQKIGRKKKRIKN